MSFFEGFADELLKVSGLIPGGVSEKVPDKVFNKQQLKAGTKIESEHTNSRAMAREIAKDHLAEEIGKGEPQKYYTKLKKMERH